MPRLVLWHWMALGLVIGLGAFFRLMWLGEAAFGADTMMFYDLCHRPLSAGAIWIDWLNLVGRTGQFPFALAFTRGFVDLFHLPVTDFTIRLPMALFGIATVPAAVLAGALLGGKRFGLFFGLLLALNPFHIQLSREGYFYPPVLLGSIMMLWSTIWIFRRRNSVAPLPVRWYLMTAVGFFLLTYSHLSGWWLACLVVPFTMAMVIWRLKKGQGRPSEIIVLSVIYLLIGIPLLVLPWAVPYFVDDIMRPGGKTYAFRIFGENTLSLWTMISSTGTIMAWGNTLVRAVFTGGVVVLTLGILFFRFWTNQSLAFIIGFLLAADMLYYIGLSSSGLPFATRYQAFIMPLYLLLLAYGIWHAGSLGRLTRRLNPRLRRGAAWAMAGAAILLYLEPAWASSRLTGNPIPYKDLARWCDTQLPPRTLVLADRWFDPWNELRVNNSTNVYFTFTVPNEPPDVYLKVRWRDTAKAFFDKFPDAAFFEKGSFYDRPEVGPWTWPSQYFARKATFTNEAGIKLREMGLGYRVDSSAACSNLVVIRLYYNTREDALAKARNQGKSSLVFFGPEWGYVKLWQQLQDFRDWRVLEGKAALDIHNLAPQTNIVTLLIRGMAVNGGKRVRFGMLSQADFQNRQLAEWRIERVPLKPGLNQFVLSDALWSVAKIPLLVDQVKVLAEEITTSPR